mmetsp:Transcript_24210/g.26886  ORF Transcript_24210/g.26886 Transcript_24210/m.26886 type:complete len:384 (-) Transcript_24210:141-1292(-)
MSWLLSPVALNEDYQLLQEIGHGAYATVWRAKHLKTGELVAVKQMHHLFDFAIARRALREIRLLRFLQHDNVIRLREIITKKPKDQFDKLYVVLDLMDCDLDNIINSSTCLTPDHVLMFMYQLLCGLKYMHSASCLHRDLKPKNILVDKKSLTLKICDLGMGRAECCGPSLRMTMLSQVATPYYRAPEGILLQGKAYDHSVDIWAAGCVFAELMLRCPLFPGGNNKELLLLFTNLLGTPDFSKLHKYPESNYKAMLLAMEPKIGKGISSILPTCCPAGVDLLEKMLAFHPEDRITVEEALRHPYFAMLHDDDDEPTCSETFQETENLLGVSEDALNLPLLRDMIWKEVKFFQDKKNARDDMSICMPDNEGMNTSLVEDAMHVA